MLPLLRETCNRCGTERAVNPGVCSRCGYDQFTWLNPVLPSVRIAKVAWLCLLAWWLLDMLCRGRRTPHFGLAFGETVADASLTPMTADEAQGYADRGWNRWVPVAKALSEIEAG